MNRQILRKIIFVGLFVIPFIPFFVSGALFFPFITTKAYAFRIVVEVVFASWLILAVIDKEYRLKRSPILYALLTFIAIIGLADLFGMAPLKSFWSNFERMEGYVTLIHLGALFLVMSSVLKEREWKWWWNTSLVASALMIVYCLLQLSGSASFPIHQGGARIDGTLGNAAYLALYFLMHVFVAMFYWIKAKTSGLKWAYAALMVGQMAMVYLSATRGAILGLLGGLLVIAGLNLFNKENSKAKTVSRYVFGALILLVVGFLFVRNSAFVVRSPVLSRLSTISLSNWKNEGRSYVWPMAILGVKEKPILGWGQDNFNYVFAEHYSAEMFRLEPWFDRAHNIFLDWAVEGGLLGLLAYLSLYGVLIQALWWKKNDLSYVEKSVFTGLITAYFFNNFFVFDNISSYILFTALLSYFHTKTGWSQGSNSNPVELEDRGYISMAIVALLLVTAIYFVNIKPIKSNVDLILALQSAQSQTKAPAIKSFEDSYNGARLGKPEVVEWIAQSSPSILADETIPMEERNAYFIFAKDAVLNMTQEMKDDPRYEIVAGNFLANVGYVDDALVHFNHAHELMPEKQFILINIGQLLYFKKDYTNAIAAFKQAYDLAPDYEQAKTIYESALSETKK